MGEGWVSDVKARYLTKGLVMRNRPSDLMEALMIKSCLIKVFEESWD